jgi:hypothetical protein
MADKPVSQGPGGGIKEADYTILASGHDAPAVGRKPSSLHPIRVAWQSEETTPRGDLPDSWHQVGAGGQEPRTIGGHRQMADDAPATMADKLALDRAVLEIDHRDPRSARHDHPLLVEKQHRFDVGRGLVGGDFKRFQGQRF